MEASSKPARRRRYRRTPPERPLLLTPLRARLLTLVAEYGMISLPQLALLACPSQVSARRRLRELFDAGLVDRCPVGRVALADPAAPDDPSLLHGSAPGIYTVTLAGLRALQEIGIQPEGTVPGPYGPRSGAFLGHELAIRDVRVWLDLCARRYPGHSLERWTDGKAAGIDLGRERAPRRVRPDAWFVYRLGERRLVGLLELDRATERGEIRWKAKLAAYGALFAGGRLAEVTGYTNARVVVVAPDTRRQERLAELVAKHAPAGLAARFWLAERTVMRIPDLSQEGWRQPGSERLRPLAPGELLREG